MATSGTTAFNLDIDDVIEDAYERCGLETRSGYDLNSARRSLNILFQEWMNRGIHLWKVENQTTNLVAGTTTYTAPSNASDVLEMTFRTGSGTNTTDTSMTKISRSEYQAIPNKFSQGQPTQYYVDPASGSDSTGDGTIGTPWASVQHAIDNIHDTIADRAPG